MRYAIFSDIHSNLEAFNAILEVFEKSNIDKYLFIGDIVGYGANPKECIEALRRLNPVSVAGNHDWAVAGLVDIDYFNQSAKSAVLWTKENISESDRLFLSELNLVSKEDKYCLVHGTLSHPEEFDYMTDGYRAMKTFYLLEQKICFVGHSHRPGVFVEDQEKVSYKEAKTFIIDENRRYIINDGSVGQPRDTDPRACFCIYDQESKTVEFKRVEYDILTAQNKIIEAGLPKELAQRLSLGL